MEGAPSEEMLSSGIHVVEFSAPWCAPCVAFAGIFEDVSDRDDYSKVGFWIVDISTPEGQEASDTYSVRSVPTIVVFEDGSVREIMIGEEVNESKLTETLDEIQ